MRISLISSILLIAATTAGLGIAQHAAAQLPPERVAAAQAYLKLRSEAEKINRTLTNAAEILAIAKSQSRYCGKPTESIDKKMANAIEKDRVRGAERGLIESLYALAYAQALERAATGVAAAGGCSKILMP